VTAYPRRPKDNEIDWNEPVEAIYALIDNGSEPYTFVNGKKVILWKVHIEHPKFECVAPFGQVAQRDSIKGSVSVACAGGLLVITEAQLVGGTRTHRVCDIVRTVRVRLGLDTDGELEKLDINREELEKKYRELMVCGKVV